MEINCKYCPKNDGTGNCLINGCPLPPVIKEIEEMQSFLEITASDNPKELIDRLTDINVYLARSGKLLADAKAYQIGDSECICQPHGIHLTCSRDCRHEICRRAKCDRQSDCDMAGPYKPYPRPCRRQYQDPDILCQTGYGTAKERLLINNV